MVLFPMYFLKSFAYAGVAVVAFAAVAAIVVTPAAIVLLGDRLDSLDVRRCPRGCCGRPDPVRRPVEQTFCYRLTKFVMRRADSDRPRGRRAAADARRTVPRCQMGFSRRSRAAASASARQVGDQLRTDFADDPSTQCDRRDPGHQRRHARRTRPLCRPAVAGAGRVVGVCAGRHVRRRSLVGPPSAATGIKRRQRVFHRGSTAPLYSQASDTQLDRLHAVAGPGGQHVQMTGTAQINRDAVEAITSRLPLVLAVIAAITFVLLFLLTGSVVLPLKALLLNVLSLTAAFGALVWIFQDGHLGAFGTTRDRHAGGHRAGAVVLHRIWAVDGLRGVPGVADPRVLAGVRTHPRPTTMRAWRWAWPVPAGWSRRPR